MKEPDAKRLDEIAGKVCIYETLPTFLYELRYEEKIRTIRAMDEECFDTMESVLLGIYLCEKPDYLIGIAEIYNYEEKKQKASIGYRLDDTVWGKGIATRVVRLLRDYLAGDIGLMTITAHVLQMNEASARVLVRNGFADKYPDLWEDWGYDDLKLTDKYVFKREWLEAEHKEEKSGIPVTEDRLPDVRVEQFVMAYLIEQDRIRAMLPEGYESLRPVFRINTEIRDDSVLYVEFNTPVEAGGRRGWLNIANWESTHDDISFVRNPAAGDNDGTGRKETVHITAPFFELTYTGTGIEGGCPEEKDNEGCYYIGNDIEFRPAETITENKESCDCSFAWKFHYGDAQGRSEGRTIPAYNTPQEKKYAAIPLSAENAAAIPCLQVLGAYIVRFTRTYHHDYNEQ